MLACWGATGKAPDAEPLEGNEGRCTTTPQSAALPPDAKSLRVPPPDAKSLVDATKLRPPETPALLDNTLLCLPAGVAEALGLVANMEDKGEEKRLWFGRAWQLRALDMQKYKMLILQNGHGKPLNQETADELLARWQGADMERLLRKVQKRWKGTATRRRRSLTCLTPLMGNLGAFAGTVVFMHGSGGMTYNNVRYVRTLAGMGYICICPDSLAGNSTRQKSLAGCLSPTDPTPYWDDLGIYTSDAEGKGAYSTDATDVIKNPDQWRQLYANIYRMRRSELRWVLGHLPQHIKTRGVFTMGQSEGAMVVARFDDQEYGALIKGRIISAFSVEYCYFTPEKVHGKFGGCPSVPTLNIIGDLDQFFGPVDSVAKAVSEMKGKGGYGGPITGNAWNSMCKQKMERGVVAVFEGARHDQSTTHDNLLRDLLVGFMSSPGNCHKLYDLWKHDAYIRSKVTLEATDGKQGERIKLRFGRDDFPSTVPYRKLMLLRQVNVLTERRKQEMAEFREAEDAIQKRQMARANGMLKGLKDGLGFLEFKDGKATWYDWDKKKEADKEKEADEETEADAVVGALAEGNGAPKATPPPKAKGIMAAFRKL